MTKPSNEMPLPQVSDDTQIRLGGAFRLPAVAPAKPEAADPGQIRFGGAFRLAA